MTGYGRAARVAKGQSMVAEIRSVNHRFLEIKLRGAGAGSALEDQVGARVRKCFERGSIVVTLAVREEPAGQAAEAVAPAAGAALAAAPAGPLASPLADRPRAQRLFAELSELASSLGTPEPTLADLIAALALQVSASTSGASSGGAPGSLGPLDLAEQLEAAGALPELLALVDEAAAAATAMRRTEGEALAKDLAARLELLAGHTAQLQRLAAESAPVLAERLHERVRKLLAQLAPAEQGEAAAGASAELVGGLDAGRLAQEVALLVDRADVTEELVRLASHLEQGRALLTQPGSLGRRLEFLLQEIGRELNTIGAKSWSSAISTRIVEAKSELEKLREQAQNVE